MFTIGLRLSVVVRGLEGGVKATQRLLCLLLVSRLVEDMLVKLVF
jgi:hypothetical protein